MALAISTSKKIIIGISLFFIGLIFILLCQLITKTENWKWFAIDYSGQANEISAYGSLLGGILSFLSVLFVLYTIFETREQIEAEKVEKKKEERISKLNRLKLISNILISTTDEIKSQGEKLFEFYPEEQANPSQMHTIYWNTNRHFGRLMNLDFLEMFNAFEEFFSDDPNWNKMLLNLYNLNDFYGDAFTELKQKYRDQIEFKVSEQKSIGKEMNEMLDAMNDVVDAYADVHGMRNHLNHPWSSLFNEYIPKHYGYLQQQIENGEMPDFRTISDELLLPFLKTAMALRSEGGFDNLGSRKVVKIASNIRKHIHEVEEYCRQYAGDIEKQYINYFSPDNESLKVYQAIKNRIDGVIQTNT